jgi:hypothetical protein
LRGIAGEDYYVDKFKAILDDDAYGKNVKEVRISSFFSSSSECVERISFEHLETTFSSLHP